MNVQQTGNDAMRYTATLALLMGMAFMLPSFSGAVMGVGASDASINAAAAVTSLSVTNNKSIKCPAGYTCIPNPVPFSDVTAKVTGDPKLVLTYDSNNKEALLTAKFNVTVDGGKNGVYVYQYPYISFHDASGNNSYVNTQRNLPLLPVTKMEMKTDSYGQVVYWVAPNRQAKFIALGSVNPKSLLSGSYTASLDVLIGENSLTSPSGFKIPVSQNQTNSKTIIGETSPYISSISPYQANAGDKVTIYGQRLNAGTVYIDGAVMSGVFVGSALDGTAMWFNIPSTLATGWHILTVSNADGMSNGVGLEIITPVSVASIDVSLDPSSPIATTVASTSSVPLLVFDLTAHGGIVNLSGVTVSLSVSGANGSSGSLTKAYLYRGSVLVGTTVVTSSPETGSIAKFDTQNMQLPADVHVPFVVKIDAVPGSSGITLSASVNPVAVMATDSSGSTISPTGGASGSTITIIGPAATSPALSNMSASLGAAVGDSSGIILYPAKFNFTLTAANASIYLLTTTSTTTGQINSIKFATTLADNDMLPTIASLDAQPSSLAGDSATYYVIPAGTSRSFSLSTMLKKSDAPYQTGLNVAQVTEIDYRTDPTSKYGSPLYPVDGLKVLVTF
ncbi:MAG TPA: hypothetical protein VL335_01620 [Candidatus Paceibacterota bacterium]|jgi:hypothetical protein|nr:hypothetical protein [Candidatus Paceibacterota bacterium]